MGTLAGSNKQATARDFVRAVALLRAAGEVALVYAAILLYIWRWQYSHPWVWVLILIAVLASHIVRKETPRQLGLTLTGAVPLARGLLPVGAAVFVGAISFGVFTGRLLLVPPAWPALVWFLRYGFWSAVQQYLAQSYFHRRLMSVIGNQHVSSALMAIMFSAAHLPNPALTGITLVWGYVASEFFAKYRNIWPLALIHVVGGSLVAALVPSELIRNMRVGPGYLFFGLW